MIKNDHQLAVTKRQVWHLQMVLKDLPHTSEGFPPRIADAREAGIKSVLTELQEEIKAYEETAK